LIQPNTMATKPILVTILNLKPTPRWLKTKFGWHQAAQINLHCNWATKFSLIYWTFRLFNGDWNWFWSPFFVYNEF
jgi:hypothetical protein